MKRLPKVTCKTDIPGLFFHKWGQYSDTFSVPEITFDADDENPAYDYLCADGFVNFPKMYRESLTGFPYFHSDFWNEDVLPLNTDAQGVSYAVLTGYDASKSDEENLPYVAAHFENRSQCYIDNINSGGLKQNSRITNFDDFTVSFDYKCDSVGRFDYGYIDPFYPAGYSFLYGQPVYTTSYLRHQIYIVNVSGGCILVTGRPDTAYIDYDTGAVTGNANYFTGILQIDFTEWHSVKIETIQKASGSVIFVYIDNVLIPFHFNDATYDRTDGGIDTDSGHLSVSFWGFNTRNAYYTGDYWYKNFRITNRPQHFEIEWGVARTRYDSEYYSENHFPFYLRNLNYADQYQRETFIQCLYKSELMEAFSWFGEYYYNNVLPAYNLNLRLTHDGSSEIFNAASYPALRTVNMTDEQLQITDNGTIYDGVYYVGYVYWPLEENDHDYYAHDGTYQTLFFVHPYVDNASFTDNWCVITPNETNYITFNRSNVKNYGYSIELFMRITEADSAAMSGNVKIMRLNTFSVSGLYANDRVFWFGYIPALNADRSVLGYWAIFSAENVVCKFPHFKNRAVSHLAFRMSPEDASDYYFRRLCVYINGSLAFHIYLRERSSLINFGQLFDSAGNSGFSGAIRGLRIITNQEVYPAIVDESRAFFSNKDTFYLQDVFSDIELGLDWYWDRVTEVMADPYFDPFELYPDYAFPKTQNDYVFGKPVITWHDERTGEELGTGSITEDITRNTKFRGDFSFENTAKGISVFMPPEGYVEMTINRQMPPVSVITTESMTVYKGSYIILDGSGSYDNITSYQWSNGSTAAQISVQIMETTTFTLTVTNANGSDSATITIVCKEVPEIVKKADIVTVQVTGQEIPLSPIPYQELSVLLNGQNCIISLRQLGLFLYCSLSVDGRQIFNNIMCSINARVNVFKSPYFTGILKFYDTQGTDRPHYSELGSRWILVYRAEELPGEVD